MSLKSLLPFLGIAGLGFYTYKKKDDESKKSAAEEASFLRKHPGFDPSVLSKEDSGDK